MIQTIIKHKYFFISWLLLALVLFVFALRSPIGSNEVESYRNTMQLLNSGKTILQVPLAEWMTIFINQTFHIENTFLTHHLIGFLLGALVLWIVGRIMLEISQNETWAIVAMVVLFLSPRPMGQMVNNLTDITFMLGYAWVLLSILQMLRNYPRFKIKTGIWLFLALALLFLSGGIFHKIPIHENAHQIFGGKWVRESQLPFYYIARWMFVSIPEFVWIGFILWILNTLFICYFVKGERKITINRKHSIVFLSLLLPIVASMLIKDYRFNGWHSWYFLYPPFVILATLGIQSTLQLLPKKGKPVFAVLLAGLAILPASFIFYNFSPDYVYFNGVTQGNKDAFSKYEGDYFHHHLQRAVKSLDYTFEGQDTTLHIVADFDISVYPQIDERFVVQTASYAKRAKINYDMAFFTIQGIHPWALRYNNWKASNTLHTFYRHGAPTCLVLSKNSVDGFKGYEALQQKNYESAAKYLLSAYKRDRNDLVLCTDLANIYLTLNDYNSYQKNCHQSKYLNPFYGPFRMVEATFNFKSKRYQQALSMSQYILKEDPDFFPAQELSERCLEKLQQ